MCIRPQHKYRIGSNAGNGLTPGSVRRSQQYSYYELHNKFGSAYYFKHYCLLEYIRFCFRRWTRNQGKTLNFKQQNYFVLVKKNHHNNFNAYLLRHFTQEANEIWYPGKPVNAPHLILLIITSLTCKIP